MGEGLFHFRLLCRNVSKYVFVVFVAALQIGKITFFSFHKILVAHWSKISGATLESNNANLSQNSFLILLEKLMKENAGK